MKPATPSHLVDCLVPDCDRRSFARGLCNKHYHVAMRLVQKQRTTWEKLEAQNKAKPLLVRTWCGTSKAQGWFLK